MTQISDKMLPLALYPLIATQGLYVKFHAAQLQEATGARQGTLGKGAPLRVLIVGDSSAAGVGVATQTEGLAGHFTSQLAQGFTVDWQLVARCGDTTAKTLKRMTALPDQRFDVVLTGLGVNDAKNGVPLSVWQQQTDALHGLCVDRFGAQCVVASGLPPVEDFPLLPDPLRSVLAQRCRQFDLALQKITSKRAECHYLPADMRLRPEMMAEDGFHPKSEVYAAWATRAADVVKSQLGVTEPAM